MTTEDISMGIGNVLKTLSMQEVKDHFKFNVFLVNIATLFRNIYIKSESIDYNISLLKKDIDTFIQYFHIFKNIKYNNQLVFYFNNCAKYIPENRIRNNSATRMMYNLDKHIEKIIKKSSNPISIQKTQNSEIFSFYINDKFYITLDRYLSSLPYINIALISHIPWDFLLLNKFKGCIIESYTGQIVKRKYIGLKVFKNNNIPFNRLLYFLLGDRYLIKPLILRNKKKILDSIVEKNNFNILMSNQIKNILIKNDLIFRDIDKLNFI